MTKFARVSKSVVAEIIELPEGTSPTDAFHPDLAVNIFAAGEGVAEGWTYADGTFAAPVIAPPTQADLLAYVALKRWLVETGGITVAGTEIKTDRNSQNMISNACQFLSDDPEATTIDFEPDPGIFLTIDRAEMVAIGIAVGRHVQLCFSRAKTVTKAILAGTITSVAEIDAFGWPTSETRQ